MAGYAKSLLPFRGGRGGLRGGGAGRAGLATAEELALNGRMASRKPAPSVSRFLDPARQALAAVPSPYGPHAAVSDAFGRVSVFCLVTLRVLRMWKGYRAKE